MLLVTKMTQGRSPAPERIGPQKKIGTVHFRFLPAQYILFTFARFIPLNHSLYPRQTCLADFLLCRIPAGLPGPEWQLLFLQWWFAGWLVPTLPFRMQINCRLPRPS